MGIYSLGAVIGLVVWMYLLSVCKRGKLTFYHFILGSIGLFIIGMAQVNSYQQYVVSMFVNLLAPIGNLTGMFTCYSDIGVFFIQTSETAMSFTIDLECSGIIEILVFVSLLSFFQVYSWKEKIVVSLVGVICIILFNAIRMVLILTIIYYGGQRYYLMAHSLVGRCTFYVLTIILYYVVFTKKQINRQRVGEFAYESSVLNQ